MAEGDANPVVYIDVDQPRTGRRGRWVVPEGDSRYQRLLELLGPPDSMTNGAAPMTPRRPEPMPDRP